MESAHEYACLICLGRGKAGIRDRFRTVDAAGARRWALPDQTSVRRVSAAKRWMDRRRYFGWKEKKVLRSVRIYNSLGFFVILFNINFIIIRTNG